MVFYARAWVVGCNETDRRRCAGRSEAKRPDQEVATGRDQFKF
jgi:hypothetical protein